MGDLFRPQPTQTSSGWRDVPESIKRYVDTSADFLRSRIGQTGPQWEFPFTAGMSPQETYGLGGLENAYGQAYTSGLMPASLEEWRKTVTGSYLPGANPYLDAIEQGMMTKANQLLGSVQQGLAAAGQGAGTPYAYLAGDVGGQLASQIGALRLGAYENERARQFGAAQPGAGLVPNLALGLMQAGALPRSLAQNELDRAYQEMLRLWNETYRAAGAAPTSQAASSGGSVTQYGPSPFMSIIGALAPWWLRGMIG